MVIISTKQFFFTYALLFVNIAAMFFLERKINSFGELVFIFLAIIFAFQILSGMSNDSSGVWPAFIIFLTMALANNFYLFIAAKNTVFFKCIIFTNIFGMVLSLFFTLQEEPLESGQKSKLFEKYYD